MTDQYGAWTLQAPHATAPHTAVGILVMAGHPRGAKAPPRWRVSVLTRHLPYNCLPMFDQLPCMASCAGTTCCVCTHGLHWLKPIQTGCMPCTHSLGQCEELGLSLVPLASALRPPSAQPDPGRGGKARQQRGGRHGRCLRRSQREAGVLWCVAFVRCVVTTKGEAHWLPLRPSEMLFAVDAVRWRVLQQHLRPV